MRLFIFFLISLVCLFPTLSIAAEKPAVFSLTTNAFLDTGALPVLYTCDGKDISPQFSWNNPPAKTKSFTFVMSDPDAPNGTFYHWLIYNIPNRINELKEGEQLPISTLVAKNDFGKLHYNGPCPPKGTIHKYVYTLYALDDKIRPLSPGDGKQLLSAIERHVIAKAELTSVYSR